MVSPYAGASLGTYAEYVRNAGGFTPCFVAHGGLLVGFRQLGLVAEMTNYFGIGNFSDFYKGISWNLMQFSVGAHVAF